MYHRQYPRSRTIRTADRAWAWCADRCVAGWLLAMVCSAALVSPGHAAGPGSLDPTFGNAGRVSARFGRYRSLNAMALQADGKIVVVGSASASNTTRSSRWRA